MGVLVSGGIEIRGLKASAISRRKPAGDPVLEEYKFVPYMDKAETSLRDIIRMSTHIGLENHLGIKVKTLELIEEEDKVDPEELLSPLIVDALGDMPLIQADVGIIGRDISFEEGVLPPNVSVTDVKKVTGDPNTLLVAGHHLFTPNRTDNLNLLVGYLKDGGFLLTREDEAQSKNIEELVQSKGLHLIMQKKNGNQLLVLLKKREKLAKKMVVVHINNDTFDWVDEMKKVMTDVLEKETPGSTRVIFVSERSFESGKILFYTSMLFSF